MSLFGTILKIGGVAGGLWLGSKLLEKSSAKKPSDEDEGEDVDEDKPTDTPPPPQPWSGTIGDVLFTAEDLAEVRAVLTSPQASQPATALVKIKNDDNSILAEVRREPGVVERWRVKIWTKKPSEGHANVIFDATAPNRPAAILRMLDRLDKGVA